MVTVTEALGWTGGDMRGSGKLVLAASGTGTISGTGIKILGRTFENAGTLTYDGSNLRFGPDNLISTGVLHNLPGGTFYALGDGDLSNTGWGSGHTFDNQGSFIRSGAAAPISVPASPSITAAASTCSREGWLWSAAAAWAAWSLATCN